MTEQPRVTPMSAEERAAVDPDLIAMAGPKIDDNMFSTLLRHPKLYKRWIPFGHSFMTGTLPFRDRELLILRTLHRCDCAFAWPAHEKISLEGGIEASEIDAVREGPDHPGWSPFDAALVRAADEVIDRHRISDATWAVLAERYDDAQLIELPMAVGHFVMLSGAINSLGIEP